MPYVIYESPTNYSITKTVTRLHQIDAYVYVCVYVSIYAYMCTGRVCVVEVIQIWECTWKCCGNSSYEAEARMAILFRVALFINSGIRSS